MTTDELVNFKSFEVEPWFEFAEPRLSGLFHFSSIVIWAAPIGAPHECGAPMGAALRKNEGDRSAATEDVQTSMQLP
jgi:hypothetical protein